MGSESPGLGAPTPVLLSQAHVTDLEVEALTRAVTSGWVAPLGPEVDGFEADICAFTGANHALALSSGTAALHLGLLGAGRQARRRRDRPDPHLRRHRVRSHLHRRQARLPRRRRAVLGA